MDGISVVIGGFIGATLGSIITGYFVESHRQKNRLQLAAIDKRLEVYQDAYRWTLKISDYIQNWQEQNPAGPISSDEGFKTLQHEANQWLEGHYLYLGKAGEKVVMAIWPSSTGGIPGIENHLQAARRTLEQEAGLPSLSGDWRPKVT